MNERILIIEDNKALSKIITKKMQKNLGFEIIQAYSYSQAKEIINENDDFFIALCDLNLPDAPNGEIVDFVISKGLRVIVLTGSIDEDLREVMLKKDIVDYVYKGNIEDVNYIFSLIKRLSKNRDIKVLAVDDSLVLRNELKRLLQSQMFKVLMAAHGEEALSYLETQDDIKLVLTDFNMPVIDGVELTKEIRQKYNKNEMIIIAMTGNENHAVSAKFLKIGANDFINKPFSKEELVCRINNALDAKEQLEKMQDMANKDFMTKLYNRRYFFEEIKSFYKQNAPFAIAMLDIDYFKKVNDTYGHDVGDSVIISLANLLKQNTKGSDIVARFGGEEFCVALRNVDKKQAIGFFAKLRKIISDSTLKIAGKNIKFTVSIGVAFSDRKKIEKLLKVADDALYNAKKSGRNRVEIA
ncbi:MAG: diguanylate cyclase [Epsilonproteobacteria bacterium]|nr:diguanylate cyclase [Campylobacterota bacterium]